MSYIPRLKKEYKSNVVSRLVKEFSYDNVMQVPKLEKIVISKGVGAAVNDKKLIDHALNEVTEISGQKAIATMSKKDVASFKLRKGMPVGVKVTLRGERMYEFLDRFVTTALPRVRDFNGVKNTGFDGRGNYNLGVTEQIIFPEINIDKINKISGMDITFVTTADSDEEAMQLLSELGLPFKKKEAAHNKPVIESEKTPIAEDVVEEPPVTEDVVEEAPVAEGVAEEAPVVEDVVEEAPVAEDAVEEAPVAEDAAEEAPVADDVVEEAPENKEEENK
jgi:large subunit ribosomal protein L5